MNHIKLFKEHNNLTIKDIFKDLINWKLFKYIQYLATNAEDIGYKINIGVICNKMYAIYSYRENYEDYIEYSGPQLLSLQRKNKNITYFVSIRYSTITINNISEEVPVEKEIEMEDIISDIKAKLISKFNIQFIDNGAQSFEFKLKNDKK